MTQNQLLLPRKGRKPMSRPEPNVPLPSLADPDNPMLVARSHLKKMELGKSSSSNKVALITRLHRSVALHEFWCASWEEFLRHSSACIAPGGARNGGAVHPYRLRR